MILKPLSRLAGFIVVFGCSTAVGLSATNPFIGGWALTIPGVNAGWLGVEQAGDLVQASMLWGGGSVFALDSAQTQDGRLVLTRNHSVEKTGSDGKKTKTTIVETITATVDGDHLRLTSVKPRQSRPGEDRTEFTGERQPPMPPAPDLANVKYGQAIKLFDGKDLDGWRLTDPKAVNGWSVNDGILINNPVQAEGKPHKNYGNLRTDREFEDFNLKLEVRVGPKQNSGVYVRGIYEIQVADTYGRPLDSHNMGAVYSRIKPATSAEKPPGEWQTLEITFVARHMTVVLNGKRIIDNQPVAGCTGGALFSDVTRPGPIYLQGDHTGIEYRNIVLRPVQK